MDPTNTPLIDGSPPVSDIGDAVPSRKKYFGFTSRQLSFVASYGLYNMFRGVYILIVGPFYPPEASGRGISTSTIGLVIGAFNLASFCSIMFYGKFFIPKCGPHRVIIYSTIVSTVCATLFGCMGFITERSTFLVASFALRLIGGAGDAGFYPAAYAVFAVEFPQLVSTTISLFEIFFGIGAIFGPIACGPLIDYIGFQWTYITVGSCLMFSSLLIICVTPEPSNSGRNGNVPNACNHSEDSGANSGDSNNGYMKLLKIPAIQFAIFCLFSTAGSIGFITGTLQVHLKQFQLTSLQVGAVFSVTTGIYTVSSLAWGQVSDKFLWNKIIIIASGSLLIAVGFIIFGPLSFILGKPYLWTTLAGLCLHGVGIGSSIIVSFSYASESAIKKGFPDNTASNGLVSSILQLPFALGNAFGPAASSALYEAVGFQFATLSVIGTSFIVVIWAVVLVFSNRIARASPLQNLVP